MHHSFGDLNIKCGVLDEVVVQYSISIRAKTNESPMDASHRHPIQ